MIVQLRERKKIIEQVAEKNGAGSIDFRKHMVLERLVEFVDEEIHKFNRALQVLFFVICHEKLKVKY